MLGTSTVRMRVYSENSSRKFYLCMWNDNTRVDISKIFYKSKQSWDHRGTKMSINFKQGRVERSCCLYQFFSFFLCLLSLLTIHPVYWVRNRILILWNLACCYKTLMYISCVLYETYWNFISTVILLSVKSEINLKMYIIEITKHLQRAYTR